MSVKAPLNIALERAINARNCNEVKILIAAGANVNHTVNQNLDTMLHKAKSAGIARDLLGYSADVHAKNLYDQTPLHSAAIAGKAELVLTLLEHTANVNARDSKGLTPMHYAVKANSAETIKHLIMNNANVTFQPVLFNEKSPLCNAMLQDNLTSAKALIKYALLKKFQDSFGQAVDLRAYYRTPNFHLVRAYLNECRTEILKAKDEKMSDTVTLFQMIMSQCVPLESLYKDAESMELFTKRCFEVLASNNYLHYREVIIEKLRSKLQVSSLRNMLSIVQISSVGDDGKKQATLNQDVIAMLGKYLSKNNLFNLILASFEPSKHQINPTVPDLKRNQINSTILNLKRNVLNISGSTTTFPFKRLKSIKFN